VDDSLGVLSMNFCIDFLIFKYLKLVHAGADEHQYLHYAFDFL